MHTISYVLFLFARSAPAPPPLVTGAARAMSHEGHRFGPSGDPRRTRPDIAREAERKRLEAERSDFHAQEVNKLFASFENTAETLAESTRFDSASGTFVHAPAAFPEEEGGGPIDAGAEASNELECNGPPDESEVCGGNVEVPAVEADLGTKQAEHAKTDVKDEPLARVTNDPYMPSDFASAMKILEAQQYEASETECEAA